MANKLFRWVITPITMVIVGIQVAPTSENDTERDPQTQPDVDGGYASLITVKQWSDVRFDHR